MVHCLVFVLEGSFSFVVVAFLFCIIPFHSFYQGGGDKDDDYVTRIEFRLLLVSLTAVTSAMYAADVITFDCRCI